MTPKQKLAKEYAILKTAAWSAEGVHESRNQAKDHEKRAHRFMTVTEIKAECKRLTKKLSIV